MKTIISLFWTIWFITVCNNQIYSQEEKFHQLTFGSENSIKQIQVYPFNQKVLLINNSQNFDNLLEIQADFKMAYIWIYNDSGIDIFDQIDTSYAIFSLPSGYYNVFTGYVPNQNEHIFIITENVDVTTSRQLKLSYNDAIYINVYSFNKINSDTLNISSIAFYFFNLLNISDLKIRHSNIDSDSFILKHNTLPTHFDGEWTVKGKPELNNYVFYLLNNRLIFYEKDTTISNDINNYAYTDIDYYMPDSVQDSTSKQIFTYLPDYHSLGFGDIYYYSSLTQRIYQDTSADISLRSSKFWQSVSVNSMAYHFLNTSEIRFRDGKIIGYHYRNPESPTFIISDTNYVQLGQPPVFWFGKFSNSIDTIKIGSTYGKGEFLFFTQTNDLPRHYPIKYEIFNDSSKVDSGLFDLRFGPPGMRIGFDPNDLAIPIQTGKYTICVRNDFNQIANIKGFSEVHASFDLNKTDKNPPNIVSFQLLSGKQITHKFYTNSNNRIRLIAEDNVSIESISLNYSHLNDTLKYKIPLQFNDPYYEGYLPILPPGYFNLHSYIMDNSQNYIECNMSPAFFIDSSVLNIKEPIPLINEMQLMQNYPNPFNSTTFIPFKIPLNFNKKLNISVYSILGQKVKTLLNGYVKNNKKSVTWNGYNEYKARVSSGIYFIRMKGGDFQKIIKVILLN
jgi:hypothetical protein